MGNVLSPSGKLQYSGYLSGPTLHWDPSPLQESYRYKQWDFYAIYTHNLTLCIAIADLKYVKNVFITIYEAGKQPITLEKLIPPWDEVSMSNHSYVGTSFYNNTEFMVFFHNNHDTFKTIVAKYLMIDINLQFRRKPNQESMVFLGPFNSDMSQFFYAQKEYNFLVDGYAKIGNNEYLIYQELGMMDWGRGVWPYNGGWIWASGMGKVGENSIAVNFGLGGPLDASVAEATDDCVFFNEKMIKLGVVRVQQSEENEDVWEYETINKEPTSRYAAIKGRFTVERRYRKSVNLLVIKSDLHQMFGVFTGEVKTIEGDFSFKLKGLMEVHGARW